MSSTSAPSIPRDYFVKSHSFTETIHRDQYPAIDPTSANLSQKGKTVVVTGASSGIGKAISLAFAKANASKIVMISRTAKKLEAAKQELLKINPNVTVFTIPTDTSSEDDVNLAEETIRSKVGIPDVLVNGAGLWTSPETIAETNPKQWWADFEVNLKGSYLMTRAFLKLVGTEKEATIISVSTLAMLTRGEVATSYAIGKLALTRLSESIPFTNPNITSISFHPGMIATDMVTDHPELVDFCDDTVELAAGTAVYLTTPEAKYLSGRYMSSNWDVDELKARKDEIIKNDLLKLDLKGKFGSVKATAPTSTLVLYPEEDDAKFDMEYYLRKHMPLAMAQWGPYGLQSYEVTKFEALPGQKLPYSAVCVMKWDNAEGAGKAMQGPGAKIVLADVPNFTTVRSVVLAGQVMEI